MSTGSAAGAERGCLADTDGGQEGDGVTATQGAEAVEQDLVVEPAGDTLLDDHDGPSGPGQGLDEQEDLQMEEVPQLSWRYVDRKGS